MRRNRGKRHAIKSDKKSIEIRDMTNEAMEEAMAKTRQKAHQIQGIVQKQANSLEQSGQDVMQVLDQ